MSKLSSPPMGVWIFVLIFCCCSLLLLHIITQNSSGIIFNRFITAKYELIRSFKNSESRPDVIVVGNSRTRFALPYDIDDQFLRFNYFRIVKSAGSLNDMIPILESLIETEPDFILIQSDMIMRDNISFGGKTKVFFDNLSADREALINELLFCKQNTLYDDSYKTGTSFSSFHQMESINSKYISRQVITSQANRFRQFMSGIHDKKTKIFFLKIPTCKAIDALLYGSAAENSFNQFLEPYITNNQIRLLNVISNLDDSLFVDHAHLNDNGRQLFSTQFVNTVNSLVVNSK